MVWYMNFCMPFLANDSVVNLSRMAMIGELAVLLLIFAILKIVATCRNADTDGYNSNAVKDNSVQSESQGEEKSSIVGKEEKLSDPDDGTNKLKNSSEFKTTFGSQSSSDTFRNSFTLFGRKIDPAEINNVFPIIFGHHAICVACAIMYSPYIYQVGASLIYCLLLIPLFFAFTSASFKIVTFIWTLMMLLNVALMMSGLIGVGIANWDTVSKACYGQLIN